MLQLLLNVLHLPMLGNSPRMLIHSLVRWKTVGCVRSTNRLTAFVVPLSRMRLRSGRCLLLRWWHKASHGISTWTIPRSRSRGRIMRRLLRLVLLWCHRAPRTHVMDRLARKRMTMLLLLLRLSLLRQRHSRVMMWTVWLMLLWHRHGRSRMVCRQTRMRMHLLLRWVMRPLLHRMRLWWCRTSNPHTSHMMLARMRLLSRLLMLQWMRLM